MTHYKPPNQIDWSDPHLESLLRKTESWTLDNRGSYTPRRVEIHVGWGAGAGKPAVLVWEREQVMVLETGFPIPLGEQVRVDRPLGDGLRTSWGVVAEGREGHRSEDKAQGVYVHWLHVR